ASKALTTKIAENRRLFLSERDAEMRLARPRRIVERFPGAVAFARLEINSATIQPVEQARDPSFSVGIGADFQEELASIDETVRYVNFNLRRIHGRARSIRDGEVRRARPDSTIQRRNRLGIRRRSGSILGKHRKGKNQQNRKQEERNCPEF